MTTAWHDKSLPMVSSRRSDVVRSTPVAVVDQTVVLRRCAQYRTAFTGAAVAYPADVLAYDAVSDWIRRRGMTVHVRTDEGLALARAARIVPQRIIVHTHDAAPQLTSRAVEIGAGRFTVSSPQQIAALARCAPRGQQVFIDANSEAVEELTTHVLGHGVFNLVGMHRRFEGENPIGMEKLEETVAEMAWIRRSRGVLLTRIFVHDVNVRQWREPWLIRSTGEAIFDTIENACARHRYPSPALLMTPGHAAPPFTGRSVW